MKTLNVKLGIVNDGIGTGANVADTLRILADDIEGYEDLDFVPGSSVSRITDAYGLEWGEWNVT